MLLAAVSGEFLACFVFMFVGFTIFGILLFYVNCKFDRDLNKIRKDLVYEKQSRYIGVEFGDIWEWELPKKEELKSPLVFLRPIPILILSQFNNTEYLASFDEAGIYASGDDRQEALTNVQDRILATFELLQSLRPDQLGPIPKSQLEVLNRYIRRKENNHVSSH